jgi:hypothetical protein
LDSAPVFRDWELPSTFAAFRTTLEEHLGTTTGARHFARILQLLGDHPLRRVRDALESCRDASLFSAEVVIRRTQVLAAVETTRGVPLPSEAATAPAVHVPRPDLSRFDLLLDRGGDPEPAVSGDTAPERQVSVFYA